MKRILLLIITGTLLQAQSIRQNVNPQEALIGDPLNYEILVEFAPGTAIEMPRFDKTIGHFTIINKRVQTRRKENLPFQNKYLFEITAFDTGYQTIPSIQVAFTDTLNHRPTQYVMTDSLFIYFHSALDSLQNIVDIYPPKKLATFTLREWLILLAAGMVIGLLFYFGFKRRKAVPIEKFQRYITPEEKAEKALDALDQKKYPLNGQFKAFYLELTYILKQYLEERYFVHILELSTTELLPVLESIITTDEYYALRALLEGADLVKFAKQSSSIERCSEDFQRVSELVASNGTVNSVNV